MPSAHVLPWLHKDALVEHGPHVAHEFVLGLVVRPGTRLQFAKVTARVTREIYLLSQKVLICRPGCSLFNQVHPNEVTVGTKGVFGEERWRRSSARKECLFLLLNKLPSCFLLLQQAYVVIHH